MKSRVVIALTVGSVLNLSTNKSAHLMRKKCVCVVFIFYLMLVKEKTFFRTQQIPSVSAVHLELLIVPVFSGLLIIFMS